LVNGLTMTWSNPLYKLADHNPAWSTRCSPLIHTCGFSSSLPEAQRLLPRGRPIRMLQTLTWYTQWGNTPLKASMSEGVRHTEDMKQRQNWPPENTHLSYRITSCHGRLHLPMLITEVATKHWTSMRRDLKIGLDFLSLGETDVWIWFLEFLYCWLQNAWSLNLVSFRIWVFGL